MVAPLVGLAIGAVARAAAKKAATNAVKKVATKKAAKAASIAQKKNYKEKITIPSKRMVKEAKKELKTESKALKAANKPTNKTGSKADRTQRAELQGNSNLIKNASPARANRTRGGSLYAQQTYGGQGLVSKNLTPKQAARQAEITKELNPVRKAKNLASKKNGNK